MVEILSIDYNKLSSSEIINKWELLDKEALVRSNAKLTPEIVDRLFDDISIDNSVIWSYRKFSEKEILKYAKTSDDWKFVCAMYKMTPEFMTEHRYELQLDYIDYHQYTAAELLRTKSILFPLNKIKHYSAEEKLRLLRDGKISRLASGSISDNYSDYLAVWDPMCLVDKKAPFKEQKPFIIEAGLRAYRGFYKLTYDNIIELFEEAPNQKNAWSLKFLLERRKLDVTNEEWDALMAIIHLS